MTAGFIVAREEHLYKRDTIKPAVIDRRYKGRGVRLMKRKKSTGKAISRRKFLDATGKYTVGGLAALGMPGGFQLNSQTRDATDLAGSFISKLSSFIANVRYDTIPPRVLDT